MREAPSIDDHRGAARSAAPASRCTIRRRSTRRASVFGDRVSYHRVNYEALDGADALLIVTEWNEFRRPDFARMKQLMRQPVIFDGRNLYEPRSMREHGFTYYSIGRPPVRPTAGATWRAS